MSKPMTRSKPAARAVCAMPTTPPAGPDRIASLPWNRLAAVSPPDDIMNIRRGPPLLATPSLRSAPQDEGGSKAHPEERA